MSAAPTPIDRRVINWPDSDAPGFEKWDAYPAAEVRKIVLGPSPGKEDAKPLGLNLEELARRLAGFPNLTHLYLWQIHGLKSLPSLPAKLECLDLRGCPDLIELPPLRSMLATLVLEECPKLRTVPAPSEANLAKLTDLSLKSCPNLSEAWIHRVLKAAPALRFLDVSNCLQLEGIPEWPPLLQRIELNECIRLAALPPQWPKPLSRLGARHAKVLAALADFNPAAVLDHVNLAGTESLRSLPRFGARPPRTLFLHGSGVDLEPELLGESDETNVAPDVFADLGEAAYGRALDHEVKIILLGNGRSGKTSLARRLVGQKFNGREESTHGVRLWALDLPFTPVDEPGGTAVAKLNIWDFGGQHLYQNTHRLFLQNRAVFVICGTDAGKGADEQGDREAERRHDCDEDIGQGCAYWQEQVNALGTGARGERPPVLVLTTKADRPAISQKWARSVMKVPPENRLEISAKSPGASLKHLKEMLGKQVAHLLGPRGARTLGKRPAQVKAALSKLKAANDKAWSTAEAKGQSVTPKAARVSLEDARLLIRQHCPDGAYFDQPELLIRRLHRAGFLYWNESHLRDSVILDQRWAIDGIYTVLNRTSRGFGFLKEARGLFTPRDLAEWEWNDAGYGKAEQALFLSFMESCGVAIRILDDYATGDQPCFMAPGFLPSGDRAGLAAPANAEVCETPLRDVECGVMVRLFQAMAQRQGREFVFWKWGLKCSDDTAPADVRLGETLWAQWTPTSPEGVTGDLRICIQTPDPRRSIYGALVRKALGDGDGGEMLFLRSVGDLAREVGRENISLSHASLAAGDGFLPLPPLLRINTSFSGDLKAEGKAGEKALAPNWKHTAFPTALRQALEVAERRERGGYRVLDYQANEAERIASLRELMAQLVKGDVLIIVLSRRYFESPYCMQELFDIARTLEGKPPGSSPDWMPEAWNSETIRTKLYWLPDAMKESRSQEWKRALETAWERSSAGFTSSVSEEHFHSIATAARAVERASQGHAYLDKERSQPIPDLGPCVGWFAASDTPAERRKVITFLDSLVERTVLKPDLLNDKRKLQNFADREADELANKSRSIHKKLTGDEKCARYAKEIERALSTAGAGGHAEASTLFFAWLDLNPESKQQFEAQDGNAPKELPEPIRRAWQLTVEQKSRRRLQ